MLGKNMIKMKSLAGVIACSILTAACAGEESEPSEAPSETGAAPVEEIATDNDPMATKDGVDYASLTGDAASGKSVFAQCRTCHVVDSDVNRIGPSLAGIIGRTAGSVEGFNYSPANKNSGITWTEEQMYVYLENPQKVIPKTKMIFGGLPDAQKRADVIAYMKNPN